MNKPLLLGFEAVSIALLMCGCMTTPNPEGQAYSAYSVGDRTRISLDEIVVSLPLKGAAQPYQNLHVGLAATINPVKTTPYGPSTVTDILQRLEARIGARVVESLSGIKEQSVEGMPQLRERVAREGQAVVDEAMHQWQHGAEYEVKVLVVSLYWTDPSVGRTVTSRRWWWW